MYLPLKSWASLILLFAALSTGGAKCESLNSPLKLNQIQEIENVISSYLKNNPEIIIEAINIFRNREKHAKKLQQRDNIIKSRELLLYDKTSPVSGNPNGDITIVEFFDYRCGYCKKVFSFLQRLLKSDKNLRFFKSAGNIIFGRFGLRPKRF